MLSLALSCVLAPTLPVVASKIVAASLFKNGYAVLTREIDIPAGGKALIEDIPQGALGTVWITTTEGLKLASVKNTEIATDSKSAATSLIELLQLNVGKDLTIDFFDKDLIRGKLLSANSEIVVVQNGAEVTAVSTNQIRHATISGGPKLDAPRSSTRRALEIRVEGDKAGRLYMIGLEKGMTWSPAYSLDITDPNKLKFVSKAVLLDDVGDVNDIEARLVTGFPNVYFLPIIDPLLAANSVEEYVRSLGAADAAVNARSQGFGLNNSFAGQQAPGGSNMDGFRDASEAMSHDNPAGIVEGDLFFYRQAHVSLNRGDRAYYVLADASIEYKEIYTWDSEDSISEDSIYRYGRPNQPDPVEEVWHSLRFKNSVGQPLTTGPATTFKSGELMGQDMLKYTSSGTEALVKITKALDIHAESADEEIARTREAIRVPNSGAFDLVTLRTVLKAVNTKKEAVHLKLTRPYTGDLVDSDNAKVTKNVKGLRRINPTGKLVWERDIEPGKTLTLTFTSKVYVRSGG